MTLLAIAILAMQAAEPPADPLPEGAVARLGGVRFKIEHGICAAALSPDGTRLAVTSGNANSVDFFELPGGKRAPSVRLKGEGDYAGFRPLAFSPDGKRLAVAGWGHSIHILQSESREEIGRLEGHTGELRILAFSADGKSLLSGSDDGTVRLWDPTAGRESWKTDAAGKVAAASFAEQGTRVVAAVGDGAMRTLDAATGKELAKTESAGQMNCSVYSPDGRVLAAGFHPGALKLIDARQGRVIREIEAQQRGIYGVVFLRKGRLVLTAGLEDAVRIWDAETGEKVWEGLDAALFGSAAPSSDGEVLVSCAGGTAFVWTLAGKRPELRPVSPPAGHWGPIESIAFSPNGRQVATAGENSVRVWDAAAATELRRLAGPERFYRAVAFSPDGKRIATGSVNTPVRLWDAATGKPLAEAEGPGGSATGLAFSPDGKALAIGTAGPPLHIVHAETGKLLRSLEGHADSVTAVAMSPAGGMLVSASRDRTIRLWDFARGTAPWTLERPDGWDDSLAVSHDGRLIAGAGWIGDGRSGSGDRTIRLWEAGTGGVLFKFKAEPHTSALAFAPDRLLLAAACSDEVMIWDVRNELCLATLRGHGGPVACLAFSPDGRTLASGSRDATILLWDVSSFLPKVSLTGGDEKLEDRWQALGRDPEDSVKSAFRTMIGRGDAAVDFLRPRLRPAGVSAEEARRIQRRVADLNHDDVQTREEAARELAALGLGAWKALENARNDARQPEVRARLDDVLGVWDLQAPWKGGELRRQGRAVAILEEIGSRAARELLRELSEDGPPGLRREAKAALDRLDRGRK